VLVLELCHGTLSDVLRGSGPLDARHVVSIGIKIASALETAHRAGILHSDVKPQNILMTRYSEPVLSDFGVARIQSSSQATAGVLGFSTIHGAPELLEGTPITASADIYALASTMYQLISGKAAFAAAEDEAPASVILRSLRDPVAPLVGPGVPIALSDLLIRSMDKAASVRPGSASELAEELAVISFDDEPTRMGDGARKHSSFETIAPSLPHSRTRCWGSGPD
jgi:serine/threonine protein kinase